MVPVHDRPLETTVSRLFDEAQRRQVVAQLRERYGAARGLVSLGQPHGNLEWILGGRRDLARDDAALDTSVSELVVLWLQDLAADLDNGIEGEDAPASSVSREAVAESLRTATREFAAAFLSPS
jgi:hypothetical protein